jgi:hypothetical protein
MLAQAIERVAEQKKLSQLGIVERLHPEMIARAKQKFLMCVPDREREIPAQMLHALRAPGGIRAQNQARVGHSAPRGAAALLLLELLFQFLAAVNARVRGNPQLAVETRRLSFELRLVCGAQHGVTQAHRAL